MKAILLLDMPKSCTDCPYLGFEKDTERSACVICEGRFRKDEDIENERSIICPLKPLPSKYPPMDGLVANCEPLTKAYEEGWNDCLDEITGETE